MAVVSELPSHEQWERARAVLEGDVLGGWSDSEDSVRPVISDKAAAAAAGVSLRVLLGWVEGSRKATEEVEPWVHDIAAVWDGRHRIQQGSVEDQLAMMAFTPTVEVTDGPEGRVTKRKGGGNLRAVELLLKARQGIYGVKPRDLNVNVRLMEAEEAWERKEAAARYVEIEAERGVTIEGQIVPAAVRVGEFE